MSDTSYMSISSHFNESKGLQNTSFLTADTTNESLSSSQNSLNTGNRYYENNKRNYNNNNNNNNNNGYQQLREKYDKIKVYLKRVIENQKKTSNEIAAELKYNDVVSLNCFLQDGNSKWPKGLMSSFFHYVNDHDTLFNESTEEFKEYVQIDSKDGKNTITQSSIEYSSIENNSIESASESSSNYHHHHQDSVSESTSINPNPSSHHHHHHHSHSQHENSSDTNSIHSHTPSPPFIILSSNKNVTQEYILTLEKETMKKKFTTCDEEIKKIYSVMIHLISNLKLNLTIEDLSNDCNSDSDNISKSNISIENNNQEINQTILCNSKVAIQKSPTCIVEESLFKSLHEYLTKYINK